MQPRALVERAVASGEVDHVIAHTLALERTLMGGAPADAAIETLTAELAEHLRALLRDALCGHLHGDLRTLADRIIGEAAATEQPTLA